MLPRFHLLWVVLMLVAGEVVAATPEIDLAGNPLQACRTRLQPTMSPALSIDAAASGISQLSGAGRPDVHLFHAGFEASGSEGSLKRIRLVLDGDGNVKPADRANWDAGRILGGTNEKDANPAPELRRIYTAQVDAGRIVMTEFRWERLSDVQQAQLDTSPLDGRRDGLGPQRVDYLRGVRALEQGRPGGVFRARGSILGDIVNRSVSHVGAPVRGVRGDGYAGFYEHFKNRAKAIYVLAGDGKLHAFDANDGSELFAYVPSALVPKLNRLTVPGSAPQPLIDGALTAAEAQVGTQWRTVLAASMGSGAQGLFALDVTNPADFGGGLGVLWEFTDADDPDIGNVMGAPVIAKFRTGEERGVPRYRHFVVVPSGLNNYKNDGAGRFNPAAQGTLFLLALDKSPTQRWQEGVNYYKFRTPISEPDSPNGLSMPALVIGTNGAVRYAYAGDLQGNLWRFDFTGSAPWRSALGTWPHKPRFVAKDANNLRQPITVQPKIVFAPGGGYVVLFGTGKFIDSADARSTGFKPQSFYAILDVIDDVGGVSGRHELAERKATKTPASDAMTIDGDSFVYGATGDGKKGWYFDFAEANSSGERSVTNPLVVHGRVLFSTLIPGGDPCTNGGGRSYVLDALTGLPVDVTTGTPSSVGLLGTPVPIPSDTVKVGDRDAIGRRTVTKRYSILDIGSGGTAGKSGKSTVTSDRSGVAIVTTGGTVEIPAGRLAWREIVNWQELRRTVRKK